MEKWKAEEAEGREAIETLTKQNAEDRFRRKKQLEHSQRQQTANVLGLQRVLVSTVALESGTGPGANA